MADKGFLPDAPNAEASSDISHESVQDNSSPTSAADKEKSNLEQLFDTDEEDDEEFPSSSVPHAEPKYVSASSRRLLALYQS